MEERKVKTFDELYSEVCSQVRGAGKSIDLCDKMKLVHSDLKRVQLLLQENPGVVTKFSQAIGTQFQGKNSSEASKLFSIAKSLPYSQNQHQHQNQSGSKQQQQKQQEQEEQQAVASKAIQILIQALRLSPWRKNSNSSSNSTFQRFKKSRNLDDKCIQWLVSKISQAVPQISNSSSNETIKKTSEKHSTAGGRGDISARNFDSASVSDEDDLLGNIYFERCVRLCERGDYKLAILDCVRGIICNTQTGEETEEQEENGRSEEEMERRVKLTFRTVSAVGVSLKALGHLEEATLVFQQATQLLRLDSTLDNQAKSRETINIVNILKDIKANPHFSPGNKQGQSSNPTDSSRAKPKTSIVDADVNVDSNLFQHDQKPEPKPTQAQAQKREKKQRKLERRQQKLHGKEPETESKSEPETEKEERSTGAGETIIPRVFGQAHPLLIAASDALDLKYDKNRGRHAVAKRTIPPGATLIMDSPYSWTLDPQHYAHLCQHCCRTCDFGIPCQNCSSVVFCSVDCWQNSYEEYHKYECHILKGLDSSEALGEMALLCYRTVCRTNVRILRHFTKQAEGEHDHENDSHNHNDNGNDNGTSSHIDHDNLVTKLPSSKPSTEAKTQTEKNMILTLGLNLEGKLDPRSFSSVFALTTNSEQRSPGEIIKRTLAAIYLTLCLRFMNYFKEQQKQQEETSTASSPSPHHSKKSDNDNDNEESTSSSSSLSPSPSSPSSSSSLPFLSHAELETAAFMLRLSQSLSCNAYGINSIPSHSRDNHTHKLIRVAESQQLGGALYPTISMINHSCNPNVFRLSIGNKCAVRSILEIQKGEELFDSYGPLFTLAGKSERRPVLKSQYFFDCDCDACQEDWPSFSELKKTQANNILEALSNFNTNTRYKCPECSQCQPTVTPNNINGSGNGKKGGKQKVASVTCPHCGKKMDMRKMMEVLIESERKYLAAKNSLISTGHFGLQLESAISNHISVLQKFLSSPHKLIVECQETLKLAWNAALLQLQSPDSSQD